VPLMEEREHARVNSVETQMLETSLISEALIKVKPLTMYNISHHGACCRSPHPGRFTVARARKAHGSHPSRVYAPPPPRCTGHRLREHQHSCPQAHARGWSGAVR
jgi:hypothetical protein